jgi:hypothetical protein
MIGDTWASKGLQTTLSAGPSNTCRWYAWWSDHGCRTWGSADCTEAASPSGGPNVTLHKRIADGSFPTVATGKYCTETPTFKDGPGATASDAECKQRCIDGAGALPPVVASTQLSDDGTTAYVRVAASAAASVTLTLKGAPVTGQVKMTILQADDLNAANSPANPTAISPQASTFEVAAGGAISIPANSFVVFEVPV